MRRGDGDGRRDAGIRHGQQVVLDRDPTQGHPGSRVVPRRAGREPRHPRAQRHRQVDRDPHDGRAREARRGRDPSPVQRVVSAGLHGGRHLEDLGTRERALHRAALRARPGLRRGVLPLAVRARRVFRPASGHLFDRNEGALHLLADAGAGLRHVPDRRGDAELDRRGIQPQGRRDPGGTAADDDDHHRLAPGRGAREIRAQGGRADGRAAAHVRHPGRSERAV